MGQGELHYHGGDRKDSTVREKAFCSVLFSLGMTSVIGICHAVLVLSFPTRLQTQDSTVRNDPFLWEIPCRFHYLSFVVIRYEDRNSVQ